MVHSIRFYISDFEGDYGNKAKRQDHCWSDGTDPVWILNRKYCESDDTVSISERRKLAQFPKINVENMKDGTFMSGFESYAKDSFRYGSSFVH